MRYWQVITALYITSSVLAGITGLLYIGLIKAPSLSLAEPLVLPSVAAAVIGGTSIFSGRGGYTGIGALILTVLTTLLTILQMPRIWSSFGKCCPAVRDASEDGGRQSDGPLTPPTAPAPPPRHWGRPGPLPRLARPASRYAGLSRRAGRR